MAQGPQHGYELKTAMETDLISLSPLNFGQVYTTLDRLERDGFVAHHTVEQDERPAKKVYEITRAGRDELLAWMGSPSVPDLDLRNATFLKLVLVQSLDSEIDGPSPGEVLLVERRACFAKLHEVASARVELGRSRVGEGGAVTSALLLDLAALRLEAFLKWLDRCEAALVAHAATRLEE
ncbi:MAG: PadR family transcriptional regulator [Thermoleophilia bacterium]